MTDLDEFIDVVLEGAEEQLGLCEHDEDVAPALLVFHDDHIEMLIIGEFMNTPMGKALFAARVLPATLRRFEAEHFAVVNHKWAFATEDVAVRDQFEAWQRDNPGASWGDNPVLEVDEILAIVFGSSDGTIVAKYATISRDGESAPQQSEWEETRGAWQSGMSRFPILSDLMLDFGMEAVTGQRLVTPAGFESASKMIAQNHDLRAMILEVWQDMGLTPEEGLEIDDPEKMAVMVERLKEMFPNYEDKIEALAAEHFPNAADEYLAEFGAPSGMVVMLSEDGEIEPIESFLPDMDFQQLLDDEEQKPDE